MHSTGFFVSSAIYATLTQKSFQYLKSKYNAENKLLYKLFNDLYSAETEQIAFLLGGILENTEICLKENE